MARILQGLEPQKVFYYFEEISKIPRGSGNEKQISDYIVRFAQERGFRVVQDGAYNVVVDIPGTPGMEHRKKIILQGHIDMVCAKDADYDFDFETQPISMYIEDGYIRAHHTTLGADDGYAVAMLLAIMDTPELVHAPLQMVFTSGEEIGLIGAHAMDGALLDGSYFIGLDCSRDDIIMVSCAGLSINHFLVDCKRIPFVAENKQVYFLSLHGLLGGHSGNMIHLGRANAIKVMGEILAEIKETLSIELLAVQGGTAMNTIASDSSATIACNKSDADTLLSVCENIAGKLKKNFRRTDKDLQLDFTPIETAEDATVISEAQADKLISLLNLCFTGAHTMIDDAFTLAESSCNIGTLTEQNGVLDLLVSIRSNSEYRHDNLQRKLRNLAKLIDIRFECKKRMASWEYQPDSPLRDCVERIYVEINGYHPEIKKIHASVEAVEFVDKMKKRGLELDLVNFGCKNLDVHTPNERLEIASVGRTYELLTRVIAELV